MQILVTGANGFIGSHLVAKLINGNYEVLKLAQDINQPIVCDASPEVIVHLAAASSDKSFQTSPCSCFQTNIMGTLNILELCRQKGSQLFFASTCAVYQPGSTDKLSENSPVEPVSAYAHSKILAEGLCRSYAALYGVSVTILRIFNVYGRGQAESFLVPYLLERAKLDKPIELRNPDSVRDFINISDVVEAIDSLLRNNNKGFEIFNLGSSQGTSVKELVKCLGQVLSKTIVCSGKPVADDPTPYTVADTNKLTELTGWHPEVSLFEGLSRLI